MTKPTAPKLLAFHKAANVFPLMKGAEFTALVEDVKRHGLQNPITVIRPGGSVPVDKETIIDGRNRYRACLKAKVTPRIVPFEGKADEVVPYIISANIHRRHLKTKEKRDAIATLIKMMPDKSDRQIAEMVKASHTTVATVRTKLEATGDVAKLATRTDTKGRSQPSKKLKSKGGTKTNGVATPAGPQLQPQPEPQPRLEPEWEPVAPTEPAPTAHVEAPLPVDDGIPDYLRRAPAPSARETQARAVQALPGDIGPMLPASDNGERLRELQRLNIALTSQVGDLQRELDALQAKLEAKPDAPAVDGETELKAQVDRVLGIIQRVDQVLRSRKPQRHLSIGANGGVELMVHQPKSSALSIALPEECDLFALAAELGVLEPSKQRSKKGEHPDL